MKKYVLDTSAFYTLSDEAPGAEIVFDILKNGAHLNNVFISCTTLTEMYYSKRGFDIGTSSASEYYAFRALPFKIHYYDEEICLMAGEIKACNSLSFADAHVVATAKYLRATLVHRDPEYESLQGEIEQIILPYKKNKI